MLFINPSDFTTRNVGIMPPLKNMVIMKMVISTPRWRKSLRERTYPDGIVSAQLISVPSAT